MAYQWSAGATVSFPISTFGKAGNGSVVAALAGKREIMKLGGLDHTGEGILFDDSRGGNSRTCCRPRP